MVEVFVAFVFGAFIPCVLLLFCGVQLNRQNARHDREIAALLDRVQSPDLATYYGARQAWHPEEFPEPVQHEYNYDDYGFVQDIKEPGDDERLPGEMPPGS